MTQSQVAEKLSNKDRTRLSRFETGRQQMMITDLIEIMVALDIPITEFFQERRTK